MFDANKQNLEDAKLAVEEFGECWLHGDGNIYVTKDDSHFRQKYSNPLHNGQASAAKYYAHFTHVNQIPDTVEDLHKMFEANKTKEIRDAAEKETKKGQPMTKVLKARPKAASTFADEDEDDDIPTREEVIKAGAFLSERTDRLNQRENVLDEKELELEEQRASLQLAAQKQSAQAADLESKLAAIAQKEAELAKKEEALKKAAAKNTPANS